MPSRKTQKSKPEGISTAKRVRWKKEIERMRLEQLSGKSALQRSTGELIPFIKLLAHMGRYYGVTSLRDVLDRMDDPFLKCAISFVVDGMEPEVIERILHARKKAVLSEQDRRMDMIIRAALSIQQGDSPKLVEAECMAFLP